MNRGIHSLHSPRLTLTLCALSMSPLSVALADDDPAPTKLNDTRADEPNVQIRASRRLSIPRHRLPTPPSLHEHGLIVGHTRYTEVDGPQRAQDHRIVGLN